MIFPVLVGRPSSLNSAGAALMREKYIMLVGGQIRDGVPATSIEIFNIKAGQSETVTSRPLVTLDHDRVSVCVGSKAYVLGGEDVLLNAGTRKLIEIAFPADVTCSRQ